METNINENFLWPRPSSLIKNSDAAAFGCSHTWGVGVEYDQTWPWLLNASNFGFAGGSTDFISRNLSKIIEDYFLKKVYILYPNYTRFEFTKGNKIFQSLPTDPSRYLFRDKNSEEWLLKNHNKNKEYIKSVCYEKQVELIAIEFNDLHQYINYPDTWPKAEDGMHFSSQWHTWVAEVFKKYEKT